MKAIRSTVPVQAHAARAQKAYIGSSHANRTTSKVLFMLAIPVLLIAGLALTAPEKAKSKLELPFATNQPF